MRSMRHAVVVGGSLAGVRFAERLLRASEHHRVTIISDEVDEPYSRPPLSKDFLADPDARPPVLRYRLPEDRCVWLRGTAAAALDLDGRTVRDTRGDLHSFDDVLIASGVSPRPPDARWMGAQPSPVKTLRESVQLRSALQGAHSLAIIGGGYLAAEMASTAAGLGIETTLLCRGPRPLGADLGDAIGTFITERLVEHGVSVVCDVEVLHAERINGGPVVLRLSDGSERSFDRLTYATGSDPNTEWIPDEMKDPVHGAVLTDERMQVLDSGGQRVPHLYAAGDVLAFRNPRFGGRHVRAPHWQVAVETAKIAAATVSGAPVGGVVWDYVPSFWSDVAGCRLTALGVPSLADDGGSRILQRDGVGSFVVGYFRAGQLVAVVGVNSPQAVTAFRESVRCSDLVC